MTIIWKQHPLKILRERAGLNQHQIAKHAGMSQTKISLAENHLVTLRHEEAEQIRNAIVELTHGRSAAVARSADPRLAVALQEIGRSPSKLKVFEMLRKSRGFSEVEAAVAVLGRAYPEH
jgi:transcriptional regulator with XRE-family HTH domain